MKLHRGILALLVLLGLSACSSDSEPVIDASEYSGNGSTLIRAWNDGRTAFGIFVPAPQAMFDGNRDRYPTVNTADAAAELGRNILLDFLFLRLDGAYDLAAIDAIVAGLATVDEAERPTFLVGVDLGDDAYIRQQVEEVLTHGVDGVVIPYRQSLADTIEAVSFFEDIGAEVWSPTNPDGKIISMFMIETAEGLTNAEAIADVGGYSALACGVGSLGGELGDPAAAEEGCAMIKAHADRTAVPSMMTVFNMQMLEQRMAQNYGWIMTMLNDGTEEIISAGRAGSVP